MTQSEGTHTGVEDRISCFVLKEPVMIQYSGNRKVNAITQIRTQENTE